MRLLMRRYPAVSGGAERQIQLPLFAHQAAGKRSHWKPPWQCRVGGAQLTLKASATVQGLWSPAPWARAELTVRLLKWRYPTRSGGTGRLFQPPIAAQRHAFVAAALRRARARSFVDLGCGDGKLLELLVTQVRELSAGIL